MKHLILDYSKLNGKVQENVKAQKTTRRELAKILNISYYTFCAKLSNPKKGGSFSPVQAILLAKALNITSEEMGEYFFSPKVEKTQQLIGG